MSHWRPREAASDSGHAYQIEAFALLAWQLTIVSVTLALSWWHQFVTYLSDLLTPTDAA